MRGWRAFGAATAAIVAGFALLAGLLSFLAPDVAYQIRNRAGEVLSGNANRKFRIATGARTGSGSRVAAALNKYLAAREGYELELVVTSSPGNVATLLDPGQHIDLAFVSSADDDAVKTGEVYALAALGTQYFFVMVPNDSPVREFRDVAGPFDPGVREPGQPPTFGERVLDYYGFLAAVDGSAARASIARPDKGIVPDFDAGRMTAATRTQFLHADLIESALGAGRLRLVPIKDNEALAQALPGTKPGTIPAGLYGPQRRIPPEPVPTLLVSQLLVTRGDLPARVVRDILEVVYDPRFARDLQYELTEESGRHVGGLPLHPAAEIYYHRNDLVTSDLLGRLSFVASAIAALFAALQFIVRYRRSERVRSRRGLLAAKLATLQDLRRSIEDTADAGAARKRVREADDLLYEAEQDAAAGLIDSDGIQSVRYLHSLCGRATETARATKARAPDAGGADEAKQASPSAGAADTGAPLEAS